MLAKVTGFGHTKGFADAAARVESEGLAHFRALDRFHAAMLKKAEGWTAEQKAQLFRREDEETE